MAITCCALRSPSSSRGLGLDEVVDPGAAAAEMLLGRLDELEAGDRAEQRARLVADALGMAEVARLLEGDSKLERMQSRLRVRD